MGEEELLKMKLNQVKEFCNKNKMCYTEDLPTYMIWSEKDICLIEALLNLYRTEKEKNKEYKQRLIFTENKSFNRKQYYKESFISKDKVREVFDGRIKNIGCEKAEVHYNPNDEHYQYWDCFETVLLNMKKELLGGSN